MLKSLKQNKKGIILMLISSLCACSGQLFWKLADGSDYWLMLIGFALYAVGALFMLIAYRHGKLSVLQPILSMNYIFALILGYFVLDESLPLTKIFGIIIIMAGVMLIGGGDDD